MSDDEGRGHDLETKDARGGSAAEIGTNKGVIVPSLFAESALDTLKDLDEICASAAARVEHLNVWAGEAKGLVEFVAEQVVDPLDHVADNFAGRIPDAELLAEFGIKSFKEGLVEVVDGIFIVKGGEEARLHAIQCVSGVIEHFHNLDSV
jgi:hypothetical protein